MKITFSPSSHSEVRKNDLRISLIMHDLDSAYTLPTPKMRFPVQSRHWFRSIPATQSDVIRPLIPEHSGHLLRESKRIF